MARRRAHDKRVRAQWSASDNRESAHFEGTMHRILLTLATSVLLTAVGMPLGVQDGID